VIAALSILIPALLATSVQPGSDQPWRSKDLKPAGGSDASTLSRGLSNDTSSVDDGIGFGKVYELPRRRGDPRRFARFNGAVIAVFPMSTYASTPSGEIPTIPPGTTYYLGADWFRRLTSDPAAADAPGLLDAHTGVDQSVPSQTTNAVDSRAKPRIIRGDTEVREPRSIWTDETFRKQRLDRLLGG
jgi:hypothetical protein